MKPVTLSVGIPVYNCREHIAQAVDSVLQQTCRDFELIIVDNCSDDGTYELLRAYTDPRIKLLRNTVNIGACGNWNRLLREFSGRYLKILCADDVLYPDCLERQLAALETADDAVMMVASCRDIIDEQGRKIFRRHYPGSSGRVAGHEVIRKIVRRGTNIIGEVSSVIIRREAVATAGEFDGSIPYVIDLDYWVRVLQHGDLLVMKEYLSAYRVSGTSWSVAITASQAENFATFITKINNVYGMALSPLDMFVGSLMARLNSQLRRVFYRLYLR